MTDTGAPTLNRPLVERIITKLIEHPEQHNQSIFGTQTACGTTCCVAGWAAVLSPEVTPIWEGDDLSGTLEAVLFSDGRRLDIDDAGVDLMGLDHDVAMNLFYDFGHTAHMIERLRGLLDETDAEVKS